MKARKNNSIRLLAECEVRGERARDIHTRGGFFLGSAVDTEHATMWARAPALLKLCERGAKGDVPTQQEFEEAVGADLLRLFKVAA